MRSELSRCLQIGWCACGLALALSGCSGREPQSEEPRVKSHVECPDGSSEGVPGRSGRGRGKPSV